jgi:hypothetical protein
MHIPQHDSLVKKRLLYSLVIKRVREYFQVTCVLAPLSPSPMSFDTTLAFIALHPKSNGYFPFFPKKL